jgi:hypothetical protein
MMRLEPALRERARRALPNLQARQLPDLLDAVAAVAGPGKATFKYVADLWDEIEAFRASGVVGPILGDGCRSRGMPAGEVVSTFERLYFPSDGPIAWGWLSSVIRTSFRVSEFVTSRSQRHAYFATAETTALVLAGCESIVEVSATANDLPSESGFVFFDRDDGDALCLLWSVNVSTGLLHVQLVTAAGMDCFLAQDGSPENGFPYGRYGFRALPIMQARLSDVGSDESPSPIEVSVPPIVGTEEAPDWLQVMYRDVGPDQVLTLLLSFTHMLRQDRLIDSETLTVRDRSSSKAKRALRRPQPVTYLSYRPRVSAAGQGSGSRNYSHQWIVRGHWRRQWYRSQQRHVPIWITEHVAGPDDKPFKASDKVTIL